MSCSLRLEMSPHLEKIRDTFSIHCFSYDMNMAGCNFESWNAMSAALFETRSSVCFASFKEERGEKEGRGSLKCRVTGQVDR